MPSASAGDAPLPARPPRAALAVPAGLMVAAAALSVCLVRSYDAPWVVAAGHEIVRTGGLPSHDPFSYTAARPWMHHEWLSEILLHLVHRVAGWPGLSVLAALLAVVPAAVLLLRPSRRRAASGPGLELTSLCLLLLGLRETAEPVAQLFSNTLFALTLRRLLVADADRATAGRAASPLGAIVLLQLLWTQLHGGNPTGVALLGAWTLASPTWRAAGQRALLLGAAAIATCVGPYGARVHEHFFAHRDTFAAVREFQPLSAALAAGLMLHLAFVAFFVAALVALAVRARRGEPVRFEATALLLFGLVTAAHVRLATETALIAAAALAPALSTLRLPGGAPLAVSLAAALLGAGAWASPRRLGGGLDATRFPIAAVEYLRRARPPGPMFNSYNFGGYLLLAGSEPVFIDGRAFTVYSDEQVRDLVALYDDPTRFAGLEQRWGFRLAVLQRRGRGAGVVELLRHRPGWSLAYEDEVASVFVRR